VSQGRRARAAEIGLGAAVAAAAVAATVALIGTACAQTASGGRPNTGKPSAAAEVPRALSAVATTVPAIALTYDDGPGGGAVSTPAILALLEAHGARATFFVLGEEVRQHPDVLRAAARAGMEIENHGQRHVHLPSLGTQAMRRVIQQGARTIERTIGASPRYLRPPFGAQSARLRRIAQALGERVVLWSVDTRDWTNPGAEVIVRRVLAHLGPGAIVLLHDGGADRSQTVEATRRLLPLLAARGYRLVTLRELVRLGDTHPGHVAPDGGGGGGSPATGTGSAAPIRPGEAPRRG
jgi:peptidoglycan/xylan/chitin deacetylase (PgdA/CDA1 family)